MVWTFILGLLSGMSVFCGKTTFLVPGSTDLPLPAINVLVCFIIALTGIATGSAYRRRIQFLKDCRDRVLMEFCDRRFFPKLTREGIITEMQVLFGILFLLSVAVFCIQYPVPKMPAFLDSNPVRIIPLTGFLCLCWIPVWPDRKNPLLDFLEKKNVPVRLRNNRPKLLQAYVIESQNLQRDELSRLNAKRSLQR